jgi:hypothetical protein
MRALAGILVLVFGWLAEGFAGTPELATKEELMAKKLYVAKCAKCHKFYEPRNYNEVEWRKWMDAMSRKSKLKPEQDKLLNTYLDAYRSGAAIILK